MQIQCSHHRQASTNLSSRPMERGIDTTCVFGFVFAVTCYLVCQCYLCHKAVKSCASGLCARPKAPGWRRRGYHFKVCFPASCRCSIQEGETTVTQQEGGQQLIICISTCQRKEREGELQGCPHGGPRPLLRRRTLFVISSECRLHVASTSAEVRLSGGGGGGGRGSSAQWLAEPG